MRLAEAVELVNRQQQQQQAGATAGAPAATVGGPSGVRRVSLGVHQHRVSFGGAPGVIGCPEGVHWVFFRGFIWVNGLRNCLMVTELCSFAATSPAAGRGAASNHSSRTANRRLLPAWGSPMGVGLAALRASVKCMSESLGMSSSRWARGKRGPRAVSAAKFASAICCAFAHAQLSSCIMHEPTKQRKGPARASKHRRRRRLR